MQEVVFQCSFIYMNMKEQCFFKEEEMDWKRGGSDFGEIGENEEIMSLYFKF